MSVNDNEGWANVERKARHHELHPSFKVLINGMCPELAQVETPKIPEPTIGQQLAWATVRCAQLQTSLHRKDKALAECRMWLLVGDTQRAQEVLNRGLLDL